MGSSNDHLKPNALRGAVQTRICQIFEKSTINSCSKEQKNTTSFWVFITYQKEEIYLTVNLHFLIGEHQENAVWTAHVTLCFEVVWYYEWVWPFAWVGVTFVWMGMILYLFLYFAFDVTWRANQNLLNPSTSHPSESFAVVMLKRNWDITKDFKKNNNKIPELHIWYR